MDDEGRSVKSNDRRFVRVDSGEEQVAYMLSRFGDPARWSVLSQQVDQAPDGRDAEHVEVELTTGERVDVAFVTPEEDDPFAPDEPVDATAFLDGVMRAATAFSEANPPHHPGTLARFPVPSASFTGALALPMPVLAVGDGTPGLFAPPRLVVVDFATLDAIGVGEFPGFDPQDWPPPQLGDWPPDAVRRFHRLQLQGTIQRFSACWRRVLGAWFERSGTVPADLASDISESLRYRAMLDLPGFLPYYDRLNTAFAQWLRDHADPQ